MIDAHTGINIAAEFQSGWPSGTNGPYTLPSQFQADLDYLWNLGFRKVRIAMQGINSGPANFTHGINLQKDAAAAAKAKGFQVSHGLVPATGTSPYGTAPGDWIPLFAIQLAHAQAVQAAGSVDIYCISNEMDRDTATSSNAGRVEQVVSATRTSNVVTVVMPRALAMITGEHIYWYTTSNLTGGSSVLGIAPNTQFQITMVNSTTFTFPSVGTDGNVTSGVWIQCANDAIVGMLKRQATALKAAGITMPLSVSCILGNTRTNTQSVYWINGFVSAGRGDIDYIDLNNYGKASVGFASSLEGEYQEFKDEFMVAYNAFGASHFRVTEWSPYGQNFHPGNSQEYILQMRRRLQFMQNFGVDSFLFSYRQNQDTSGESDWFVATKPYTVLGVSNGQSWRDYWYKMVGEKQRQSTIEVTVDTPTAISGLRTSAGTRPTATGRQNAGTRPSVSVAPNL